MKLWRGPLKLSAPENCLSLISGVRCERKTDENNLGKHP